MFMNRLTTQTTSATSQNEQQQQQQQQQQLNNHQHNEQQYQQLISDNNNNYYQQQQQQQQQQPQQQNHNNSNNIFTNLAPRRGTLRRGLSRTADMYNLNVSLTSPSLLSVDGVGVCTTPRTPEILNSLIAMTSPLEYSYPLPTNSQVTTSNNQPDSHSSCSGSPLDSPTGNTAPPSVQQTCSQLIKAGLKLSIQSKRKLSGGDSSGSEQYSSYCSGGNGGRRSNSNSSKIAKQESSVNGDDTTDDDGDMTSPKTGLTPEDEDRRRRRRERNKIAATKCRMKKRERTINLVSESEVLENQNNDLKRQVHDLEIQRRRLMDVLQDHGPACVQKGGYKPPATNIPACKYLAEITTYCEQHQGQQLQQQQPPHNGQRLGNRGSHQRKNNNQGQNTASKNATTKNTSNTATVLPPGYMKASPNDFVYAPLSPDSGFIKSSPDSLGIGMTFPEQSYSTLGKPDTQQLLQDYIPNCENSNGATSIATSTSTISSSSSNGSGASISNSEFMLKTEMCDVISPYTTVQSADRFLFETADAFGDTTVGTSLKGSIADGLPTQPTSASGMNNSIDLNLSDIHTNLPNSTIQPPNNEFNANCQPFDASTLIKTDFSADFLSLDDDDTETQFTDMDSGITTYTNITNGGCLV